MSVGIVLVLALSGYHVVQAMRHVEADRAAAAIKQVALSVAALIVAVFAVAWMAFA